MPSDAPTPVPTTAPREPFLSTSDNEGRACADCAARLAAGHAVPMYATGWPLTFQCAHEMNPAAAPLPTAPEPTPGMGVLLDAHEMAVARQAEALVRWSKTSGACEDATKATVAARTAIEAHVSRLTVDAERWRAIRPHLTTDSDVGEEGTGSWSGIELRESHPLFVKGDMFATVEQIVDAQRAALGSGGGARQ